MSKKNKPKNSPNPPMPGDGVDIEDTPADDAVIGRAIVGSLAFFAVVGVVIAGAVYFLNREKPRPVGPSVVVEAPRARAKTASAPATPLVDITAESGIDFVHFSGAEGEKLLPETMGGGCAAFDYDNDGDQDLFFVNSCSWPWAKEEKKTTCRLYRNDGKARFEDVSQAAGLDVCLYGMGCAVGDYDNDGWPDLYVTAVGSNRLFHNEQGSFKDVTEESGVGGSPAQFASSAGFFDYDNDGALDLVACNYVTWSRDIDLSFAPTLDGKTRAYGPPIYFAGTWPLLFRNLGGGKFADVTEEVGFNVKNPNTGVPRGKSLGLILCDFDEDGWVDVMTANDTVANILLKNQGGKSFVEVGQEFGVGYDANGLARGAMGIDFGDFRNDGSLGIAIGNYANEMTSLYVSQQRERDKYADEAIGAGLGPLSRTELKFAVLFLDYDLDGRLDLLSANGHLEDRINQFQSSQTYRQPPHLYWNTGAASGDEFAKAPTTATGEDFHKPIVGRGATYADLDGDGDLDLVVFSNGEAPRVLRNDQALGNHWIRLKLVGANCNRDAVGARVELTVDGKSQRRAVSTTRGYLSAVESPLTFGLGKADKIERVSIVWPDGQKQELTDLAVDQTHVITQAAP